MTFLAFYTQNGKPLSETLPDEHKENYENTFKGIVPPFEEYEKWKHENNISAVAAPQGIDTEGYKIEKELKEEIYNYLNGQIFEAKKIINSFFKVENDDDPFYTKEGIQMLSKYFNDKCPSVDTKYFLEKLAKGGIQMYKIMPKAKESTEETAKDIKS